MKSKTLVLIDSGGRWYKENGGIHNLESALRSIGFDNIVIHAIAGGTAKQFAESIRRFAEAHQEYMIDNGNRMPVLPPGFNQLDRDTQPQ